MRLPQKKTTNNSKEGRCSELSVTRSEAAEEWKALISPSRRHQNYKERRERGKEKKLCRLLLQSNHPISLKNRENKEFDGFCVKYVTSLCHSQDLFDTFMSQYVT
jgi:cobalamin biosynthesis protein CobT